jgi:ABC-type glutathione transport system ATPase component
MPTHTAEKSGRARRQFPPMLPIEVSHLVVAYRRWFKPPLRAVDDLSFVVREGEIVGFLGALTARARPAPSKR